MSEKILEALGYSEFRDNLVELLSITQIDTETGQCCGTGTCNS